MRLTAPRRMLSSGRARNICARQIWEWHWRRNIIFAQPGILRVARPAIVKAAGKLEINVWKRMSKENDVKLNLLSPSDIKPASLEVEEVRKKLAGATGPRYWRTLEEL